MYVVLTGPLIRRRLALSMAAFFVVFIVLTARLFYLQVISAEALQKRAQAQWTSESVISPTRGKILDRNGAVLALSATAYTACASPRQVKDVSAFAALLSPILDVDASEIVKRASDRSKGGVILKRQLSRDKAQEIKTLMTEYRQAGSTVLDGLYLEEDVRRYYPMGDFASQLLGLTTIDGVGQAGLEGSLDEYLSGKAGRVLGEIDGKGRELSYGESEYVAAIDGGTVTLTIDSSIQSFAEKAAREALSINNAKAVRVLAMDPQTGEILAMACKPGYDLNDPPRNDVETLTELMRNRIVTDAYEPGSTFKILTSAAALDAGVTNVHEGFYCSGSTYVEGGKIRCWGKPHGAQSMAQALQNSCNPVFVELGLRLGIDRLYDYLELFGIGEKTGVDITGESPGIIISRSSVKRVDIARIGFGQSVAVTPIQLLSAACSVVNGGRLLKPYVVKDIVSENGEPLFIGEPTLVKRTISEKTSELMRILLEDVVTKGGGKNAYIEGYRVGGKTGTAQVYVDGAVSTDVHIGSFIGFAPMEQPRIAVMVIVDEADVAVDYGSVTSAPYARDILEQALIYMGVAPDSKAPETVKAIVPDIAGMALSDAISELKANGFSYVLDGSGAVVLKQLPAAGAMMAQGSIVMLYVDGKASLDASERVSVPDVTGLSVLEANRLLRSYGFSMTVEGGGIAVSQSPEAGALAYPTAKITVIFEPP